MKKATSPPFQKGREKLLKITSLLAFHTLEIDITLGCIFLLPLQHLHSYVLYLAKHRQDHP